MPESRSQSQLRSQYPDPRASSTIGPIATLGPRAGLGNALLARIPEYVQRKGFLFFLPLSLALRPSIVNLDPGKDTAHLPQPRPARK